MSAHKSNMPGGTRLAALSALAIIACLFAWRANSFLTDHQAGAAEMTPAQLQLTSLLEPLLGNGNVRIASHTDADGTMSFLVLVNRQDTPFQLDPVTNAQIAAILQAAAGYDETRDQLQIQPLAFKPGYSSGFANSELIELCALLAVSALLILVLTQTRSPQPVSQSLPEPRADNDGATLHAIPLKSAIANEDGMAEAQRIARQDPKKAANILRSWMKTSEEGPQ